MALSKSTFAYRLDYSDYSIHIDTNCLTYVWMITIKHLLCFFALHLSFLFFSYEICRCVNVHVDEDTVRRQHSTVIRNAITVTSCKGSCHRCDSYSTLPASHSCHGPPPYPDDSHFPLPVPVPSTASSGILTTIRPSSPKRARHAIIPPSRMKTLHFEFGASAS